jgi:hypothetical protein
VVEYVLDAMEQNEVVVMDDVDGHSVMDYDDDDDDDVEVIETENGVFFCVKMIACKLNNDILVFERKVYLR